ncbi:MAG: Cyn operon transcriptional activator [Chloroflexi bacterium AL-W]|nr:Cyn operon transcriptional activator [Chloroflexi bacterium AL-N1]NOK70420.1 Cyn operon transcriptional activator [Chloroflexi bacterium AL-N10]NOK78221.1 Cyn operon transcriptional activator [Chloroflexi bacterium AL-N5]NOK85320.1 Cyn operon transcriptional activator [Chloroflexi bacterium AL-W]NOK92085.1 Cyn operon transcriptional activator [Chloroflexi bacterium AL-N15]
MCMESFLFSTTYRYSGLVEPSDFLQQQNLLVFREGCTYRTKLEQLVREQGMLPRKVMEFGTVEAILGCVAVGMGITLFPRSVIMCLQHVHDIKFHTLPSTTAHIPTMLIWRTDVLRTKAMNAFVEVVQEIDQSL